MGGGFGGAPDGIRFGGFGADGDSLTVVGTRTVAFELTYGGMLIEKAANVDSGATTVFGTLFGIGAIDLHLTQDLPTDFQDAVDEPFMSKMGKNFYAVEPYIASESRPASWLWARFQIGLLWTLSDP